MKRILTLCLALCLILTTATPSALASTAFAVSQEGVDMIKELEGFQSIPYLDNEKWYIGYGVQCDPADYPGGVDEIQAEELLRQALVAAEGLVNGLLAEKNISLNQQQFDALVSFTYSLGDQWMREGNRIYDYLLSGIEWYTETQVVNAMATWCHQNGEVLDHVAKRRLREAFLFLYGEYDNEGPDAYYYIHYHTAGGAVPNSTVFYPAGLPLGELPIPTLQGQGFLGWYLEDGVRLTGEEIAEADLTATARWSGGGAGSVHVDISRWTNPYTDVSSDDWAYAYIGEMSIRGVMRGSPDGTFQGAKALTAGEAMKLVLLAAGFDDPGNAGQGHWASAYLAAAEEMEIVLPGEVEALDEPITRLTMARMMVRAMGLRERTGASPFADVDDGSTLTLYEEGIFTGTILSGKRYFHPDENITRAEAAAVFCRVCAWTYKERNDPAQTGYIEYHEHHIPLLRDVMASPYNPNLFVLDGSTMYYNDPDYITAIGIDVSSYQPEINWEKVAGAGIQFVIIRLGYRGYGAEGTVNLDSKFKEHLAGARAAGLQVGVYFFSQAISRAEAVEEAAFVLDNLGGETLDYPVVYDWEPVSAGSARTRNLDAETLTDCAAAFCETIAGNGYTPMIYAGQEVAYQRVDLTDLMGYDFWFPQYTDKPNMYYNYRIWQYTNKGVVPGIEGEVDMDIALIPY